jgi:hypothetical protein
MELVVKKRLQILLTASNLLSLGSDVHTNGALLNLHSPRADEGDNEDNCKKGVKENLNGVVTGNPVTLHLTPEGMNNSFKFTLNGTNGRAGLENVRFTKPMKTRTNLVSTEGNEHINNEDNLKEKEENTTHYLAVIEITQTENKERELNRPVTLDEGVKNFYRSIFNTKNKVLDTVPKLFAKSGKPQWKGAEEEKPKVVPEGAPFTEL